MCVKYTYFLFKNELKRLITKIISALQISAIKLNIKTVSRGKQKTWHCPKSKVFLSLAK